MTAVPSLKPGARIAIDDAADGQSLTGEVVTVRRLDDGRQRIQVALPEGHYRFVTVAADGVRIMLPDDPLTAGRALARHVLSGHAAGMPESEQLRMLAMTVLTLSGDRR